MPPIHVLSTHEENPKPNKPRRIQYTKIKTIKIKTYHLFDGVDTLVDQNMCNHIVDSQLKRNRTLIYSTSKLDKHINVILRKKDTHGDLADFLGCACFSPNISTFLRTVENNHFTTWPDLTK